MQTRLFAGQPLWSFTFVGELCKIFLNLTVLKPPIFGNSPMGYEASTQQWPASTIASSWAHGKIS
jgi:hypothetical protein